MQPSVGLTVFSPAMNKNGRASAFYGIWPIPVCYDYQIIEVVRSEKVARDRMNLGKFPSNYNLDLLRHQTKYHEVELVVPIF